MFKCFKCLSKTAFDAEFFLSASVFLRPGIFWRNKKKIVPSRPVVRDGHGSSQRRLPLRHPPPFTPLQLIIRLYHDSTSLNQVYVFAWDNQYVLMILWESIHSFRQHRKFKHSLLKNDISLLTTSF